MLASVLLYWQRRANAHQVTPANSLTIEPGSPKKEASTSEIEALQKALLDTRKQLEGIPDRTAGMSDMISRLTATVNQLKADMQNEQLEKSQLKADLENTRILATQATAMMTLVEQKEHGATWRERVMAELKLSGGYCTDVALRMGRELEATVRKFYYAETKSVSEPAPAFKEMLRSLSSAGRLTRDEDNVLYKAWRIRCKLAHESSTKAGEKQGTILITALEILESRRKAFEQ